MMTVRQAAAAGAILAVLACLAFERNGLWRGAAISEDAAVKSPARSRVWNNLGNERSSEGDLSGAIAAYGTAGRLDPSNPGPLLNIGALLIDAGRASEALPFIDGALVIDIRLADAWYDRGNALAALSRHSEAVASYRRAVEHRPGFIAAWSNLGASQQALGLRAEAAASYRRALELDPGFTVALRNLEGLQAGRTGR